MVSQRDVLPLDFGTGSGFSSVRPAPVSPPMLRPLPFPAPRPAAERVLTPTQIESIQSAMRVFVEDDLARGIPASRRSYCDACQQARPAPGFIQYDRYSMCNCCAVEYEAARAKGLLGTAGQFVRDKHFGESDVYSLST